MYPAQLLMLVLLILSVGNGCNAGKLEEDVVKTARVAFRGSLEPVIVCRSYEERCSAILRAAQQAEIVFSNWSLKGFRLKLNLLKRHTLIMYDAILVVIKNLETLAGVIHKMILLHSQAHYVVVEVEEQNSTTEDCCRSDGWRLLQELWTKKRMHRIVILRPGCPGYALTADIFDTNETKCTRKIPTDDAYQLKEVFTRRIKNMNGQVLRITMSPAQDLRIIEPINGIPYEGVDATILREYVRFLNFTAEVSNATGNKPYAYTYSNGTMVGSAIDLTRGTADLVFNGNFMYYLGATPAQISKWYKEDALCVVIKKAGQVPKLVALFTPFSIGFLWGVFTVVWLAGGVLYGIRMFVHCSDWDQVSLFHSIATVTGFMIECPMAHKYRSNAERMLLASCSIWAVVVMGTYHGCLRGSITIPKDLKDIDSLLELDQAGYTIYVTSENLKTVFQAPGSQLGERLVRRTVLVKDTMPIVLSEDNYAGTLTRKESSHRRVRPHEHLVPDCVRRSQLCFFMRIGCPGAWALNKMLSRFGEAGIIQFLRITERRQKEIQDQRQTATTSQPGQFSLEDVQGAFLILAVGTALSIPVFGFELLNGRSLSKAIIYQKRRKALELRKRQTKNVPLQPHYFRIGT